MSQRINEAKAMISQHISNEKKYQESLRTHMSGLSERKRKLNSFIIEALVKTPLEDISIKYHHNQYGGLGHDLSMTIPLGGPLDAIGDDLKSIIREFRVLSDELDESRRTVDEYERVLAHMPDSDDALAEMALQNIMDGLPAPLEGGE